MTEAAESDAVLAFIRERQGEVLAEAVRQLAACSREDLPDVAHAVSGSLGSYQLDDAYAKVMALRALLADDTVPAAAVDQAWHETVTSLQAGWEGPRP